MNNESFADKLFNIACSLQPAQNDNTIIKMTDQVVFIQIAKFNGLATD